jgi:hypothetical protein
MENGQKLQPTRTKSVPLMGSPLNGQHIQHLELTTFALTE